jgi:hypothetical protein
MTKKAAVDLAERVAFVFAAAFLSSFTLTDMSTAKSAGIAGLGAVLQLLSGLVATQVRNKETAGYAK